MKLCNYAILQLYKYTIVTMTDRVYRQQNGQMSIFLELHHFVGPFIKLTLNAL
jgi:hypothetical protein